MKPFELISTLIFFCALIHTLLTPRIYDLSKKMEKKMRLYPSRPYYHISFEILSLLSQVEIAFAIWLIPLLISFASFRGWAEMDRFLHGQQYSYPLFMMVIMIVVSSKPLIIFAEKFLERISRFGGDTGASWWWTILTVTPLLGLILKESGAMTLAAILLSKKFYQYKPSKAFQYTTLVLCLSNIAVAGLLVAFGTRALILVYEYFELSSGDMFLIFGWKALLGMIIVNGAAYLFFRKEFKKFPSRLPTLEKDEVGVEIPFVITLIQLLFLVAIILTSHSVPIFLSLFFLFLAFHRATLVYQSKLKIRPALLVGIFFASLLLHGELQGWWVRPILTDLNHFQAMMAAFILSAFLDNAIVNYFSVQVPSFDTMKAYFIVAGTMSSSALTIMSNLPNAIAFSILRPSFHQRISFVTTFLYALIPAFIYLTIFWLFRHIGL